MRLYPETSAPTITHHRSSNCHVWPLTPPPQQRNQLTTFTPTNHNRVQHVMGAWWLRLGGRAARFMDELAGAVNRVNYNQHSAALNALVGGCMC